MAQRSYYEVVGPTALQQIFSPRTSREESDKLESETATRESRVSTINTLYVSAEGH